MDADSRLTPAAALTEPRVTATEVIRFESVTRHWGRGKKRWAVLRDVDLSVPAGTAVCVRGANGTGKTTLLRIATGMLAPDAGTVQVYGIDSRHRWRDYHRHVGFLSAGDRGLYNRFTVRHHLEYVAKLEFIPSQQRPAAIAHIQDAFGLEPLLSRRSERLSQGQRQRLRLALALVHQPKLLLLDEPRNSLDGEGLELLAAEVRSLISAGASVLWACPVGEDQPITFDRELEIADATLRDA